MKDELLLIDKPEGITSFDVIRLLRKKLSIRKMGHSGTLDPAASGLLLIGIGDGTKLLTELIGSPKVYLSEILLGVRTSTGDRDGEVVEEKPIPEISDEEIQKILAGMVGNFILPVSPYSAMKRGGKKLYEYAREGIEMSPTKREMEIRAADFVGRAGNTLSIRWDVGSGTYIRSLAEELGKRLGTVASLKSLRRISISKYKVEDAEKIIP